MMQNTTNSPIRPRLLVLRGLAALFALVLDFAVLQTANIIYIRAFRYFPVGPQLLALASTVLLFAVEIAIFILHREVSLPARIVGLPIAPIQAVLIWCIGNTGTLLPQGYAFALPFRKAGAYLCLALSLVVMIQFIDTAFRFAKSNRVGRQA